MDFMFILTDKYDPSQEDDKKLEATGDSSEETSATKVLSPVKQTSLTEEEIDEKLKIANDLLQMHLGETTPTIKGIDLRIKTIICAYLSLQHLHFRRWIHFQFEQTKLSVTNDICRISSFSSSFSWVKSSFQ